MGRFVSADSIVPGNAAGGMDGIAYKPLTVDVHEPGFVSAVNRENQFGPWYTLSDNERRQVGSPWGPANPQALNRYAYVLNNPMRWTDPVGHWAFSVFISIRITILAYSTSYSGGYTWDDHGLYARTYSTSQGTGVGFYGGVGVGASISPGTKTLNDALGSGSAVGMSGGPLAVVGFDSINPGTGKDGVAISVGGGAGFEWHMEATNTSIAPKGCVSPHGSACGRGANRPKLVNKPKLVHVSPKNRKVD